MTRIKIAGKSYNLPANSLVRIILGIVLICGGILGFLPILGFWMIPLGLLVLSADIVFIRKLRRMMEVKFGRWFKKKKPQNRNTP